MAEAGMGPGSWEQPHRERGKRRRYWTGQRRRRKKIEPTIRAARRDRADYRVFKIRIEREIGPDLLVIIGLSAGTKDT